MGSSGRCRGGGALYREPEPVVADPDAVVRCRTLQPRGSPHIVDRGGCFQVADDTLGVGSSLPPMLSTAR